EDIYRAHPAATQAQDIGVQDRQRRAAQVAARDLLDEARHIDVGGAGVGAGRVEAEQAAGGFHHRLLARERSMDFREIARALLGGERRDGVIHADTPPACAMHSVKLRSSTRANSSTSVLEI